MKRPLIIAGLKIGLKQLEGGCPLKEGDDAFLKVDVDVINSKGGKKLKNFISFNLYKLESPNTSLEYFDKYHPIEKTNNNQCHHGDQLYITAEIINENGKEHFKQFELSMLKIYM